MNNFNFCIVEGNLIDAAGVINNGCEFFIASNRECIKDGEKFVKTLTVKITAYDKLGEVCNKYLNKGSKVLVSGTLTEDGLEAKEVNFLSPKG